MKTTITTATLMAIAAAAALTSCSEDEPLSYNHGDYIAFRPAMGSRAVEVTNANLESFNVYGFLNNSVYIDNVAYTKSGDGFFNSTTPYYWPGDDTPLTFYAYSPSLAELFPDEFTTEDDMGEDVEGFLTMTDTEKKLENFRVADSIANQVDFITATGTGKRSVNESAGLELTFDHRLAQIEIRAKSSSADYVYIVKGARIGRAQTTGSFDFTTNTWTLDEWHDTAVFDAYMSAPDTLTANAISLMGPAGNAMLIPQSFYAWDHHGDPDNVARAAYLSVLVQIKQKSTGTVIYPYASDTRIDATTGQKREFAWASVPISGSWEQGKKYIYTLDFSNGAGYVDPDDPTPGQPVLGDPIKFTINVNPWVDAPTPETMPLK